MKNESNNDFILTQSLTVNDEQVICPHCRGLYRRRGLARHIHCAHSDMQVSEPGNLEQNNTIRNFANQLPKVSESFFLILQDLKNIMNGIVDDYVQ